MRGSNYGLTYISDLVIIECPIQKDSILELVFFANLLYVDALWAIADFMGLLDISWTVSAR